MPAHVAIRVDITYRYANEILGVMRREMSKSYLRKDKTGRARNYHRVVTDISSIYIVLFMFLARLFLCACPKPPLASTVLSPDCDGKRGGHFNVYISGAGCPPSPAGGEGAIGLPAIGPVPSTLFALLEPRVSMPTGVLTG